MATFMNSKTVIRDFFFLASGYETAGHDCALCGTGRLSEALKSTTFASELISGAVPLLVRPEGKNLSTIKNISLLLFEIL